jgi:hypothetical protein
MLHNGESVMYTADLNCYGSRMNDEWGMNYLKETSFKATSWKTSLSWGDKIKMKLGEVGYKDVNWCRVVIKMVSTGVHLPYS